MIAVKMDCPRQKSPSTIQPISDGNFQPALTGRRQLTAQHCNRVTRQLLGGLIQHRMAGTLPDRQPAQITVCTDLKQQHHDAFLTQAACDWRVNPHLPQLGAQGGVPVGRPGVRV